VLAGLARLPAAELRPALEVGEGLMRICHG